MKWEKVSLESISTKIGDGLHGTPKYDDSGEFYFINGNNLSEGKIIIKEDTKRISSIEFDKIKKELSEKTVLVAINGTLGNVGLYRDEPVALGKSACYINVNDKAEKLFVRYVLENNDFQRYARDFATGSTIKNLGLKAVRDYSFNLPPLPTQRRIASILSAYDDLIENNLKRIKLLEEKAQLHCIQYKPIEKIMLQEIADYLGRGVTPKYEEGSGFYAINQKANKGSLLEFNQFKSLDSKLEVPADKLAKWGDMLINSLGEGTLGRVHFYTDKSDLYAVDQHMSIFRTQKQHYTFYLYQFLSSNYGQGLLDSLKKGGTNMTMLNISDLRQLEVSFPTEKCLIELWTICKPLFQLKQILINQNSKLREARDILLPKLMNGQIEV